MVLWDDGKGAPPVVNQQLSTSQCSDVQGILTEYNDVFSSNLRATQLAEHRIETGSAKPVCQPPYRLPHMYRDAMWKELQVMEKNEIIKPSRSEWASPIVLAPKKDGTLRMCVDYRRLNGISEADTNPMP